MTNTEIFDAALRKARNNAYCGAFMSNTQAYEHRYEILFGIGSDKRFCFAQAFWGEEIVNTGWTFGDYEETLPAWQYHLRQMVLEENPIEYIKEFL